MAHRFAKTLLLVVAGVLATTAACGGASSTPVPTAAPTHTAEPLATASLPPLNVHVAPDAHDGAIGITVTVPSALWRYDSVARGFATGGERNGVPDAIIFLWTFPAGTEFWVYGDPCHWQSTRPATPATTASEVVAGLAAQASRHASTPIDVTVGGHTGKSVTLSVPDDAVFAECDAGDFTSYGVTGDEPTRYAQGPGQIDEFWVVDVEGAIAVLDATYRPDTPAVLIEQMRSIAQSLVFQKP
jgi:hypothetical protein